MPSKINIKKKRSEFLTTAQAAEMLNLGVSTLKKFIFSGKLKVFKTPGGHYRISKKDLLEEFCNKEK